MTWPNVRVKADIVSPLSTDSHKVVVDISFIDNNGDFVVGIVQQEFTYDPNTDVVEATLL